MSLPLGARQSFFITPPRVAGSGPGEVFTVATSTTAGAVDMRTIGPVAPNLGTSAGHAMAEGRIGALGNYVSLYADGADLAVVFGPTYLSVTGANAPSLTAVGTIAGNGIYTNAIGTCAHIAAGTFLELCTQTGLDLFLGFVSSGTGKIRMYQNSPAEA